MVSISNKRCSARFDLQTFPDGYRYLNLTSALFIRGPNKPANEMNKSGQCVALEQLLRPGIINLQ